MSGSNPFRRKQQAQSNHNNPGASEDEVGRATLRFPALDTGNTSQIPVACTIADASTDVAASVSKPNAKKVRIVSPHSSTHLSNFDASSADSSPIVSANSPATWGDYEDHVQPHHRAEASSEDESYTDPFQVGSGSASDSDAGEEHALPLETADKIHSVPQKARSTLNVDTDNPWRTSTLIGNHLGSDNSLGQGLADDTRGVPTKAQKTLGILRAGSSNNSNQRYPLPTNTQAVPPKAQRTLGIPSNPFQKNLALPDNRIDDGNDDDTSRIIRDPSLQSSRPQLDVDAFTRLLMTGDKTSPAASTPSVNTLPIQGVPADSSSNTDASSLSRQSIQESQTELHVETPRTSHESSPSIDEANKPTRRPSSLYDISSSRTPRTGEKPSRAGSTSAEFPTRRSSTDIDQLASASTRLSTDLNKPLPPPPISPSPDLETVFSGATLATVSDFATGPYEQAPLRPRVAPAPPLARRSSQLRSKYLGTTSGRSAPIVEENAPESQASASPASSTPKKSPAPPPPPRRRETNRNSIFLEPSDLPELGPASPKASPKPDKQPPPVPPARTISVSKRHIREPSVASVSGAMPPPPPPRRRGSSASSLSLPPRTSSELGRPGDEVTRPPAPASRDVLSSQSSANIISKAAAGNRDVLADLSKLQQEVDALRGIYDRRRSSGDQSH
jgi:hypothetical protein